MALGYTLAEQVVAELVSHYGSAAEVARRVLAKEPTFAAWDSSAFDSKGE
jgi:hypothetical protein